MTTATKNTMPTSKAKTAYGLLSEIRKLILAEPKRYNQSDTLTRRSEIPCYYDAWPACGTVGCVAGWTAALVAPNEIAYDSVVVIARRKLDLSEEQANELFDGDAADGEPQTAGHARRGVRHIWRFQKKYAKQLKATKL